MKRSPLNYLFILIFVLLSAFPSLAGPSHAMAAPGAVGPEAAPEECYCAQCGMLVRPEGLFASQIIFRGKKTAWFCDIGDMLLYYDGLGEDAGVSAVYVKDYSSGSWIDATSAYYLTGAKVTTPMSYNIIAFESREGAEMFRDESGGDKVVSFGQALASKVWEE